MLGVIDYSAIIHSLITGGEFTGRSYKIDPFNGSDDGLETIQAIEKVKETAKQISEGKYRRGNVTVKDLRVMAIQNFFELGYDELGPISTRQYIQQIKGTSGTFEEVERKLSKILKKARQATSSLMTGYTYRYNEEGELA